MNACHSTARGLTLAGILLLANSLLPQLAHAGEFSSSQAGVPRSTVPILCTDHYLGGRTRARGTGVVIDTGGKLLTAGHVVTEHQLYCELTALVPDADWSRTRTYHAYSVRDCSSSVELDLAVCQMVPVGRAGIALQAATLRTRFPRVAITVTATGFTGWGLAPTSLSGFLRGGNYLRKEEECYCDFSISLTAFGGMSGGPVTDVDGGVIGIVTTTGTGRFRGLAFGTSIERALAFLQHHGIVFQSKANSVGPAK